MNIVIGLLYSEIQQLLSHDMRINFNLNLNDMKYKRNISTRDIFVGGSFKLHYYNNL